MGKILSTLAIALAMACGAPQADAISINFVPATSHVAVGGSVSIDVVVSGLDAANEIVSAFDLNVLYNGAVVNAAVVTVVFAPWGDGSTTLTDAQFAAGNVGVLLASLLTDDEALAALQGDSFTLFTVTFQGLGDGFTLLQFGPDPDFERNVVGRDALTLPAQFGTACISVGEGECRIQVPEPGALFLLALGLVAFAGVRRRRTS